MSGKKPRRSQSWFGRLDRDGFIYRSWTKNGGVPHDQFDGRPVIRICNTFSELTPCNSHFRTLAEQVKIGVYEAAHLRDRYQRDRVWGVRGPGAGVEGLIHVSELSWGRVRHPSDVVKVGDQVGAYVIQVDRNKSRIALSLKRLRPNPWETAEARYRPGDVVEAKVTSVVPFGAFARLEEGLDGLIHLTEFTNGTGEEADQRTFQEGETLLVRVINVDASRQRLQD